MLKIRDVFKKVFDGLYISDDNYFLFPQFFTLTKVTTILQLSINKSNTRSSRSKRGSSLSILCPVIWYNYIIL